MQSPLAAYYHKESFNPTEIPVSDRRDWEVHRRKRFHLYVNKLKLPQMLWSHARILEVGPSSGENALVWACEGAVFEFVEPCAHLTDRLKRLFDDYGVRSRIGAIHHTCLEEFQTPQQFDLVIAEGFLHCLPEKNHEIQRLAQWVKSGGLLVMSTEDIYGSFLEHLKVCVFRALCQMLACNSRKEKLTVAKDMLYAEFQKIPHSRSFEAFVRDSLMLPVFSPDFFWGLEEFAAIMDASDFYLYSSWPNYLEADDLTWHKVVGDVTSATALRAYRRRIPWFLAGGNGIAAMGPNWTEKTGAEFGHHLLILQQILAGWALPATHSHATWHASLNALAQIAEHLWNGPLGKEMALLFAEIQSIFTLLFPPSNQTATQEEGAVLLETFKSCVQIKKHWGMPYHYMVWHKNG